MPAGAPSPAVPAAAATRALVNSPGRKTEQAMGFHPATTFLSGRKTNFVHSPAAAMAGKKGYWFATSQGLNGVATVRVSCEVLLHGEMNAHYAPEASA
jgi:hypothetical protein